MRIREVAIAGFLFSCIVRGDEPAKAAADDIDKRVAKIETEFRSAVSAATQAANKPARGSRRPFAVAKPPSPDGFAARMLAVANDAPKSSAAFQACRWIVQQQGGPRLNALQEKAVEALLRDHLANPGIADICSKAAASRSPAVETFFRGVLANSPERRTQAYACQVLAFYLDNKALWVDYCRAADARQRTMMASNPEGKEMLDRLSEDDASALRDEAQSLRKRAKTDFADIAPPKTDDKRPPPNPGEGGLPVGAKAPEIVGKDFTGKAMRLSDYRGKVVVVDFWGLWCVYSRAELERRHGLQSRMQGRNFALLGVNSDPNLVEIKKRAAETGIDWPNWWDGGGPNGPIAKEWKVTRCPTSFVIDQEGVIRFKNLTGKQLDEAIESLLK